MMHGQKNFKLHSMTFAHRRNRLTTHLSERSPSLSDARLYNSRSWYPICIVTSFPFLPRFFYSYFLPPSLSRYFSPLNLIKEPVRKACHDALPMWNAMVADTTLISAFSVKHEIFVNVAFVYLKHRRNRSKGSAGHCPLMRCVQSNELHICVSQHYTENWPGSEEVTGNWREFHNDSCTICCFYQVFLGWLHNSGKNVWDN